MSEATRAVALDVSKAFDRLWHGCLPHKLKSHGMSCQIFGLISFFLSNIRLRVLLDGKSLQEYLVNAAITQASIVSPTLFDLFSPTLMTFLMMLSVILFSMLMILLSTLSVIRHLISNNNWNWLLNLNLNDEALCTGAGIGSLMSMLEKLN